MAIYERRQPQQTPEERSVERIRMRLGQAVMAMRQAVRDVRREVGRHGRQPLAQVVQAQGDSPAEMASAYDALKTALKSVTDEESAELPQ